METATVYERFLNVSGGTHNGDFVARDAQVGGPALTSFTNKDAPADEKIRRSATADLEGSYDGASTFTAKLNAYGSREDGPKTTVAATDILASSRATFAFTLAKATSYSLSGLFTAQVTLPSGNSVVNASVQLVNTDTGVAAFAYQQQVPTSGMPFNTSGRLDPGHYQLLGVANFSNVTSTAGSSNGGATVNRADFTFKVGERMPIAQNGAVAH